MQQPVHMDQGGLEMYYSSKERILQAEQQNIMQTTTPPAKKMESPDERGPGSILPDPTLRYLNTQRAVHAQYVLQLLQIQRRAGFLCDITIQVRDKSFKAHKPLLAACSLYFRSLFANAETMESTALNLNILTPIGFEVLLDYIYSGSLAITAENSTEVLSAATCLQMTNVVETCLNFMRSSFRMSKSSERSPPVTASLAPMQNGVEERVGGPRPTQAQQGLGSPGARLHGSPMKRQLPRGPAAREGRRHSLQDNLQILSSGSINEDEFKSMVIASSPRPTLTSALSNGDNRAPSSSADHLPTTSQLQSVLPYLLVREPRQPTLQEVQQFLSSVPQTTHQVQPSATSHALDSSKALYTPAGAVTTSLSSVSQVPACLAHTQPLARSGVQRQRQESVVGAGRASTTQCPGEHHTRAPEHYSGEDLTAAGPSVQEENFGEAGTDDDGAMTPSDQGNHLEISDDDDEDDSGGCVTWSADRSAQRALATDPSGTPCTAGGCQPSPPNNKTSPPLTMTRTNPTPRDPPDTQTLPLDLARKEPQATSPTSCDAATDSTLSSTSPLSTLKETNLGDAGSSTEDPALRPPVTSHQPQAIHNSAGVAASPTSPIASVLTSHSDVDSSADYVTTSEVDSGSIKIERMSDEEDGEVPPGFPVQSNQGADCGLDDAGQVSGQSSVSEQHSALSVDDQAKEQDNSVLDLSMPARSRAQRSSTESERRSSRGESPGPRYQRDPGKHVALATLDQLRQTDPDAQAAWIVGDNAEAVARCDVPGQGLSDERLLNSTQHASTSPRDVAPDQGFSRKPRRTSGGYTCGWTGCGRLFRHRNIFLEHQRLHDMGIPVSQLRRCYMGARVKKTVREQLEELRTNETTNDHDADSSVRSRKRKQASAMATESARKRVTMKDRAGSLHALNSASTPSALPLSATAPLHYRAAAAAPALLARGRDNARFARPPVHLNQAGPYVRPQPPNVSAPTLLGRPSNPPQHVTAVSVAAHATPNSAANQGQMVNPVEATLALLGIPTPVRRGEAAGGPNAPLPGLSLDQIRRRLALRETSVVHGLYSAQNEGLAARTGTVSGRPPHPPAYPAAVQGGIPQVGFRAPLQRHAVTQDTAPRPNQYPGPGSAPSSQAGQGAKCS